MSAAVSADELAEFIIDALLEQSIRERIARPGRPALVPELDEPFGDFLARAFADRRDVLDRAHEVLEGWLDEVEDRRRAFEVLTEVRARLDR